MNILIKLTCLIGLVIAPILGGHSADAATTKASCCAATEQCASMSKDECIEKGCTNATCEYMNTALIGKCDMSKCATMTKEECAAMCDKNGCSAEDKAKCMAMYDENGTYKGEVKQEVTTKVIIEKSADGKAKATITKSTNGVSTQEVIEGTEAEVKAKVDAIK